MSDTTDDKGGINAAGVVGGVVGGAAAYKVADKVVASRAVKQVLNEDAKAPKGFVDAVTKLGDKPEFMKSMAEKYDESPH